MVAMSEPRSTTSHPTQAPLAAIDIGTNSFHLVIARPNRRGGFEVLTREKETVRLGSGAGELDHLQPDAIERGVAALRRFKGLADGYGARVAAVATSAVREATNRDEFLRRAQAEAGVRVDVISGVEEARLIHLGVVQAVPIFDRQALVVDIGGGSTEFVVARADDLLVTRSTKVGAIRLTERFFASGTTDDDDVSEARRWLASFLVPTAADVSEIGFELAVGSSGTISAVAAMVEARAGREVRSLNNRSFSRAELAEIVDQVLAAGTTERRARLAGLDPRRADIIVGGVLLLEQVFESFGITEMTVSEFALREGVLFDRLRTNRRGFHHLDDIRRRSVDRLAVLFHEDQAHVQHATDLALQMFDDLVTVHGYGVAERDLLEAGGALHNVGLFVSHGAHHKHSHYVIRNTDQLLGFTDREIEIMALVARYHRRSEPKAKHTEFSRLDPPDQQLVRVLAGLLRVGIALDRRGDGRVRRATAVASDTGVEIAATVKRGADASLEAFTANERCELLAHALCRPVDIVVATPSRSPRQ